MFMRAIEPDRRAVRLEQFNTHTHNTAQGGSADPSDNEEPQPSRHPPPAIDLGRALQLHGLSTTPGGGAFSTNRYLRAPLPARAYRKRCYSCDASLPTSSDSPHATQGPWPVPSAQVNTNALVPFAFAGDRHPGHLLHVSGCLRGGEGLPPTWSHPCAALSSSQIIKVIDEKMTRGCNLARALPRRRDPPNLPRRTRHAIGQGSKQPFSKAVEDRKPSTISQKRRGRRISAFTFGESSVQTDTSTLTTGRHSTTPEHSRRSTCCTRRAGEETWLASMGLGSAPGSDPDLGIHTSR